MSRQRRPREIQGSLFTDPPAYVPPRRTPAAAGSVRRMVRHPDLETSVEAAERVKPGAQALREEVLAAFIELGPMNDGELEELPRFKGKYAYSTVRKRRSELSKEDPPRLVVTEIRRDHPLHPGSSMKVWRVPE